MSESASPLRRVDDRWVTVIGWVAALLPVAWMTSRVRRATDMQYADYWDAFARFTDLDGGLVIRGLFTYQNEHPFLIPNIVYYLDSVLFAGTNRELGYFSIAVALATVILLRTLLPPEWSSAAKACATFGMSVFVFAPVGIWNFSKGMSGTAWLTANLLAVIALVLATRDRFILASIAALLAITAYGTGFGAPVLVAVVAFTRRERWWKVLLPMGCLAVSGVVYLATANEGTSGGSVGGGIADMLSTYFSLLGVLWVPDGGTLGIMVGAGGLGLLGMMVANELRDADGAGWKRSVDSRAIPWIGLATYVVVAGGVLSLARADEFDGSGAQSRYASLSALFWIAVGMLAVVRARRGVDARVVAGLAVAVAVVFAGGTTVVRAVENAHRNQDTVAASVRFGAPDAFPQLFHDGWANSERLRELGNFPFNDVGSAGCGLEPGDTVDTIVELTGPGAPADAAAPRVQIDAVAQIGEATSVAGWAITAGNETLDCALAVNEDGVVVGSGITNIARHDVAAGLGVANFEVGFQVFAPVDESPIRVLVGDGDRFWMAWSESAVADDSTGEITDSNAAPESDASEPATASLPALSLPSDPPRATTN